jgi:hypothetical protein
MDPENITPGTLPDGSQLNPADVNGAVGNGIGTNNASQQMEALSLAEINNLLGKTFPSKEIALKSIKDTFSYVGKPREAIEKEVRASLQTDDRISKLAQELEVERKERFFDRNPQYADPAVRKLIEGMGGNPADIVNREEFKNIFEKVSSYDKSTKLKTVLESNPRMVSSRDNLTKARDTLKSSGQVTHEVQSHAVNAVKEAFGL